MTSSSSPLVSLHQDDKKKNSKSKKKRSREEIDDLQEERRLTALLFGTITDEPPLSRDAEILETAQDDTPIHEKTNDELFQVDDDIEDEESEEIENDDDRRGVSQSSSLTAAWVDNDDEDKNGFEVDLMDGPSRIRKLRKFKNETVPLRGSEYEERLRGIHEKTTTRTAHTSWAKVGPTTRQPGEVVATTKSMLASFSNKLKPNVLSVLRCPDANQLDPSSSVLQAIHFHPASDEAEPLLLTAGLDKTLRFFKISPSGKHEKIHGIHFPKLPIYSARFLGDTNKVVVSGRRPFYYIYDMSLGHLDCIKLNGRAEKSLEKMTTSPDGQWIAFCGNDGYVLLVHIDSPHVVVATTKLNGSVRALNFANDSHYLYASGSDGQVYKYDLTNNNKECVNVFQNVDGTITSSIASTPDILAVGAESGVVNLYSTKTISTKQPSLIKSIMNVQTSIDFMSTNHDGQILAFGTKRESQNALKLLHVPSATVFSNWPTSKTPLGHVWCVDFSPSSHYVAIGNDKGKCLLYKLLHYSSQTSNNKNT